MLFLALSACGGPEKTSPDPEPIVIDTLLRLSSALEVYPGDGPTKVRVQTEYRDVMFAPYRTTSEQSGFDAFLRAHVETSEISLKNAESLRLGDVVDVERVSPEAVGIAMAYTTDINKPPQVSGYFGISSTTSRKAIAAYPLRVSVPAGYDAEEVFVRVREVIPMPHVYRSRWIEIPVDASLEFGIGFEDPIQHDPAPDIRFLATIESRSGSVATLFDETHAAPVIGQAPPPWQDEILNLDRFAGEVCRFVFRTEAVADAAGKQPPRNTTSAVWSVPILSHAAHERAAGTPPNLILISLDTLRADHLGTFGYERDTTPNLDRIMKDGVLFEQCIAPASWTTPSHASVFTGLHPAAHRAGTHRGMRLRDAFVTLAEIAGDEGYLTAAFTEGVAVSGQLGFYQGFDRYSDGPGEQPPPVGTAKKTFGRAKKWIEGHDRQPFMAFVHTYEIHAPYAPPEDFLAKFSDGSVESVTPWFEGPRNDDELQTWIDLYDDSIAYVDTVIGDFYRFLEERGLLENSVVVIFSDHGEEFGEHGGSLHGLSLFDEQLHVPLFIRPPGKSHGELRVNEMVSLTDTFATLIDLLGFDADVPPDSMSLLPLFADPPAPGRYTRSFASSHTEQTSAGWLFISAREDAYKYILSTDWTSEWSPVYDLINHPGQGGQRSAESLLLEFADNRASILAGEVSEERLLQLLRGAYERLYDLKQDPQEQQNLASEQPAITARLRGELRQRIEVLQQHADLYGNLGTVAPLSEEEKAALRSMGYVFD